LRTAIHLLLTCYYFPTTRSALTPHTHTHGNHPDRKSAENCDLVPSLTETTSSEINARYFIRRSILARRMHEHTDPTESFIWTTETVGKNRSSSDSSCDHSLQKPTITARASNPRQLELYNVLVTATPVVTQRQKCSGRTALRLLCADHPRRRRAAVQSNDQLTSSRTCQTRPHDVTEKHNNRCSFRANDKAAQLELLMLPLPLHSFNSLFSRTTRVSRYQKGKTSLDLNEARDNGGFGVTVASAGPYANDLHLAPDR